MVKQVSNQRQSKRGERPAFGINIKSERMEKGNGVVKDKVKDRETSRGETRPYT